MELDVVVAVVAVVGGHLGFVAGREGGDECHVQKNFKISSLSLSLFSSSSCWLEKE